jgi:hypothetical protein
LLYSLGWLPVSCSPVGTCNSRNSFDDCQPDYDLQYCFHWLGVTFPSSFFLEDSDCSIRPLFSCRVALVIIPNSGTMRCMLSPWLQPVHGISVRIRILQSIYLIRENLDKRTSVPNILPVTPTIFSDSHPESCCK